MWSRVSEAWCTRRAGPGGPSGGTGRGLKMQSFEHNAEQFVLFNGSQ